MFNSRNDSHFRLSRCWQEKIGGATGVPVASLRLVMIREGQEDYEWLRALAAAKGRAAAVAAMAPVMTAATAYTRDPSVIAATRRAIAAAICS